MPPTTRRLRHLQATLALVPAALAVLIVYLGCTAWTIWISMTGSRSLPRNDFVGLDQYRRLFASSRWEISMQNMAVFGVVFISVCLVLGFLLAVAIDRRVRAEALMRTVFLYPYSMSFVVTGLVWQWFLNPELGLQHLVRSAGFESFTFDWIVNRQMVVFALVIAAVWHGAGLVMAIMLAGLRGIDEEIWKAARVDGIPPWRVYLFIILPMLGASVTTATVLLAIGVVKLYDLVVAMTDGGPGLASEVPAKFVMAYLFERANIGLATAASTVMLIAVLAVLAPWVYATYVRPQRGAAR